MGTECNKAPGRLEVDETELCRRLKAQIQADGPMTFREFMAQALFAPGLGFYSKGPALGARDGPFNTNSLFPAFAFALARAVERAEAVLGEPLRIVELGGGTGELASRILKNLTEPHEYVIVEKSPGLRAKQESLGLRPVSHPSDLQPAPSFVFGNEVLDALPVNRVMCEETGELLEIYVALDQEGKFVQHLAEPSTPLLAKRLAEEGISLGRGQIAEINLGLEEFVAEVASLISKGYLIFIDYGDEATALYHYTHRNGSLRCFYKQKPAYDPFDRVGEQDITADVDFTALEGSVLKEGLMKAGKVSQGLWLENVGVHRYKEQATNAGQAQDEIFQLVSPARLGSAFDVLAFKTRGLPDAPGFS